MTGSLLSLPDVAPASTPVNPLKSNERRARLTAIQILQNLKPIEEHVRRHAASSAPQDQTEPLVEITGDRVNFRAGPSTDTQVLAVGLKGEVYQLIGSEGDWHHIRIDDARQAYVTVQFSRLIEQAPSPRPTPTSPEEIEQAFRDRARMILGENADALDELQRVGRNSESLFERRYANRKAGENEAEFWAATESASKIRKYVGGVTRQYERFASLAGGQIPRVQETTDWLSTLQGMVSAGMGSNSAETQQNGAVIAGADASRSEIAAELRADFSPNDRLGIDVGRTEEVHFASIARTRAGVQYDRKLGEKVQVSTNLGLSQYDNESNDQSDVDQTEFGVRAQTQPTESFNADIGLALAGAAYPNNDDLDYKDTRLNLGAGGRLRESSRWRVTYGRTSHDVDLATSDDDNTQSRLTGDLTLRSGGSSTIRFSADAESRAFDESTDTRTYSRYGFKFEMRGQAQDGKSQSGSLEYRAKSFDELDYRNYSEIRGELRSQRTTSGGGRRSFGLTGNFRSFKGDGSQGVLNYLESRMDVLHEPGNGFFWESNIYGQYFFKDEDVEANPLVTEFVWLGLVLGGNGAFKVGPHFATNTIIVTTDVPDVGAFEHPSNTLRYGVKGAVNIRSAPVRIRGSARYELLSYYNVDNAPTPSRLELQGEGTYDINQRIGASVKLKLFTTGSDDQNAVETSELDILFSLIYRIGQGALR